jgi:flagellar basal body-associated protein FliL
MEEQNTSGEITGSQRGVSNTTIAVLLVLALVITIIGTWAVMNSMTPETPVKKQTNVAQVTLTIKPSNPGLTQTSGRALIELKKAG